MSGAAGFLEALGLVGFRRLEPVVLAALAIRVPLLLVGPHGTAKSMLVERVARALRLPFRHYNASLVNYDDLVGIPLPDETGKGLRFVGTEGAIWGAGFAFFDEISRCRPELQNKLFPLIHERRVAGMDLPTLQHRWAAMNPPARDDGETGGFDPVYLGSESLDAALADRFGFVVRVPTWSELSPEARLRLVSGASRHDKATTRRPSRLSLAATVSRCARLAAKIEARERERIADYVVQLVDELGRADVPLSPRRARALARNVAAVQAARLVLHEDAEDPAAVTLEQSAELALRNGLPQIADAEPPASAKLVGCHKQAWEVSSLAKDDVWRKVLVEPDPAKRVAVGVRLELADADLSRLVTRAIASEADDARRIGLSTALFLGLRKRCSLTPAAWEALAQGARRVLEPFERAEDVAPGPDLERWREISRAMVSDRRRHFRARVERSFVMSLFPDVWRKADWRKALEAFRGDLDAFGVRARA